MPISKERLNEMKKQSEKTIDFSDIPPLTSEQLSKMRPMMEVHPEWIIPKNCTVVAVPIETDVLNRINSAGINLESYIKKSIKSVAESLAEKAS